MKPSGLDLGCRTRLHSALEAMMAATRPHRLQFLDRGTNTVGFVESCAQGLRGSGSLARWSLEISVAVPVPVPHYLNRVGIGS